jgi:hypothetical protein
MRSVSFALALALLIPVASASSVATAGAQPQAAPDGAVSATQALMKEVLSEIEEAGREREALLAALEALEPPPAPGSAAGPEELHRYLAQLAAYEARRAALEAALERNERDIADLVRELTGLQERWERDKADLARELMESRERSERDRAPAQSRSDTAARPGVALASRATPLRADGAGGVAPRP